MAHLREFCRGFSSGDLLCIAFAQLDVEIENMPRKQSDKSALGSKLIANSHSHWLEYLLFVYFVSVGQLKLLRKLQVAIQQVACAQTVSQLAFECSLGRLQMRSQIQVGPSRRICNWRLPVGRRNDFAKRLSS